MRTIAKSKSHVYDLLDNVGYVLRLMEYDKNKGEGTPIHETSAEICKSLVNKAETVVLSNMFALTQIDLYSRKMLELEEVDSEYPTETIMMLQTSV